MSYLARRFNIPAPSVAPFPANLTITEQHIVETLSTLLELVDEHLRYWETTRALRRVQRLQDARATILQMMSALQ